MKKRIAFAVLMTALIITNFTYAFKAQSQAGQVTVNITVSAENQIANTEPTTVKAQPEPESTSEQGSSLQQEMTTQPKQTTAGTDEVPPKTEETTAAVHKNDTEKTEAPTPQSVSVTVSINCENAVKYGYDIAPYLLQNEMYTVEQGATVFDVLKALCDENGISLKYQRKTYIQGIGGLNEKDCGTSSGWMYLINGEKISKPASSYTLQNGDVIEWRYVTNPNE